MSTRQYGKQFFASKSGKVLALPFQLGKVEEKVVHTSTLLLLLRPFTMSLSEQEIPTHLSSRVLHVMLEIPQRENYGRKEEEDWQQAE